MTRLILARACPVPKRPRLPWRWRGGPPEKPRGAAGKGPSGEAETSPHPVKPPKKGRSEGPGPHEKGPKPPRK